MKLNHEIAYKVLNLGTRHMFSSKIDTERVESLLNRLGKEGWDLVAAFDQNVASGASDGAVMILKKYVE